MSRLQRGSGTWDPLFGLALERLAAGGRWVGSIAARTPVADNDDGLRVGASWEVGSGWAHTVRSHRVMGYGRFDWLHREQDVFNGTPVLVGGGNWFYASPGVAVMMVKGINVPDRSKDAGVSRSCESAAGLARHHPVRNQPHVLGAKRMDSTPTIPSP